MLLKNSDLLHLDAKIDAISATLSNREKEYATRVSNTFFEGRVPNEFWLSFSIGFIFEREFYVMHYVDISDTLLSYINYIIFRQFAKILTTGTKFEFEIKFEGVKDEIETEEISPLYWGDCLIDTFRAFIRLEK